MLMRDDTGDGRADWIERHASGFNQPYGLAYRDGEISVADQDGIWYRPPAGTAAPDVLRAEIGHWGAGQ